MQPIPRMPTIAHLVRVFMRKFHIRATGRSPIVKSVMAAPTLYKYAMPMRTLLLTHLPDAPCCARFQKKSTGLHWNIVKKKKMTPTAVARTMAEYKM